MMAASRRRRDPGGPLERAYDAVIVGLDPAVDYASALAVAMAAVAGGRAADRHERRCAIPDARGIPARRRRDRRGPGDGDRRGAGGHRQAGAGDVHRAILEAAGMAPAECVVVGDNPDADVAGAHRAGCAAILVLTGVADRGTVRAPRR